MAVLLAHSKIALKKDLISTSLLDEERMLEDLALYFPVKLRERFASDINQHPLKRDIIATFTANSMINRMGPHFAIAMQNATGCQLCDVVRAYTIVREIFSLRKMWHAVEALDNKVTAQTQHKMLFYTTRLATAAIAWLLREYSGKTMAVTELVNALRPKVQEYPNYRKCTIRIGTADGNIASDDGVVGCNCVIGKITVADCNRGRSLYAGI